MCQAEVGAPVSVSFAKKPTPHLELCWPLALRNTLSNAFRIGEALNSAREALQCLCPGPAEVGATEQPPSGAVHLHKSLGARKRWQLSPLGLHKDLSQGWSGVVRLPSNSRIEATASSSSIRHESSESRQQRSKVKPPRLGLCYLGSVYACNASALQGSLFPSIARTCPTENLLALL